MNDRCSICKKSTHGTQAHQAADLASERIEKRANEGLSQREYFKRGREWEIAEYKRHLTDHNPQIEGQCSWCRMEVEAGRAATQRAPALQGVLDTADPRKDLEARLANVPTLVAGDFLADGFVTPAMQKYVATLVQKRLDEALAEMRGAKR